MVLVDANMVALEGDTHFFRIKEHPAFGDVPLVVLAARDTSAELIEICWRAGVDDCIMGPLRLAHIQAREETLRYVNKNGLLALEMFLQKERADIEQLVGLQDENVAIITSHVNKLEASLDQERGRNLLATAKERRAIYVKNFIKARNLLLQDRRDEANAIVKGEVLPSLKEHEAAWTDLAEFQGELVSGAARESSAQYLTARSLVLGLIAVAIFLAVVLGVLVTRGITAPLASVVALTAKIAKGDLRERPR